MRAGDLDRRVTLQRAGQGDDGLQTTTLNWADLSTVWASRQDISDGERGRADGTLADATTRFRIRWSETVSDLSPKDRLTTEGQTFDIVGVKQLGRRYGLEITAKRHASR